MIEQLKKEQIERIKQKKKAKKKFFCFLFLIFFIGGLCAVFVLIQKSKKMETTYYYIESSKISKPVKAVVLSDLHNEEFGPDNSFLVKRISEEKPDIVFMLGDMVNQNDRDITIISKLCEKIVSVAPVYYILGNHEGSLMYGRIDSVSLSEELENIGINVLNNNYIEVDINGNRINIAGISTNEKDYDQYSAVELEDFWHLDGYKILLSHYPSLYYYKLKDVKVDLALAGHYHGGIIRLPKFGALYHPDDGIFPRYAGGEYELTYGKLIVTRGLGNNNIIPRINNRPELTVIELDSDS